MRGARGEDRDAPRVRGPHARWTSRRAAERLAVRVLDYAWAVGRICDGLVRRRVPDEFRAGRLRPVLLIPGVLENWSMMRALAERLNRAGHPVHVLPELRRNTAPIDGGAALAAAYLRACDLQDVVIVAHSKGGLIAKQALLGPEAGRIRRVIAIATPFAGSALASWVPSRTIRALRPGDPMIRALVASAAVNGSIISIHPGFDPHIPDGSGLDGAVNLLVERSGHFRVLGSSEVHDAVLAAAAETAADS